MAGNENQIHARKAEICLLPNIQISVHMEYEYRRTAIAYLTNSEMIKREECSIV